MKQNDSAHFELVRIHNRKIVRNKIRENPRIGKTELASMLNLTFPTVSSAIKDLLNTKEIIELNKLSRGGRPGTIYALNETYQYVACAYLDSLILQIRIYNACGEQCDQYEKTVAKTMDSGYLIDIFSKIKEKYNTLSVISLGIPGVVIDGVIKYLPYLPNLEGADIQNQFNNALGVVTFIENDINAIVYAQKNKYKDLAHIIMCNGCIGTGIMINNQLIRGAHGSAGEIEYICDNTMDNIDILSQGIVAITCVVDIADINISGIDMDNAMISQLIDKIKIRLPQNRIPNIHIISNVKDLYYQGLLDIALEYCKNC